MMSPGGYSQNNNGNGNGNGYDFLIDEEYQINKQKVIKEKWFILGQKTILQLSLKNLLTIINDQRDNIKRQKNYIESSAKKGLQHSAGHKRKKSVLSNNKGNRDLNSYMREIKENVLGNNEILSEIFTVNKDTQSELAKYQDKCEYLERQLSDLTYKLHESHQSQNHNKSQNLDQHSYIESLEAQLNEMRSVLLEKKLLISDKVDEIRIVKLQNETLQDQYYHLELQKKELDSLIIKVSQDLRQKDYSLQDFNYQLFSDKENMTRQIDILQKQIREEREQRETLERVEREIIVQMEQKEGKIQEMQMYIQEIDSKLLLKTDSIEKAQRVIEKLTTDYEKTLNHMSKVEQDRDQLRVECKEQSRRILDLNKQIHTTVNQQQMTQIQMGNQLKTEVTDLKEALRNYQQEFDSEKTKLLNTLREVNDEKYNLQVNKEKQEIQFKKQITQLNLEKEEIHKQYEKEFSEMQKEIKVKEDEFKMQLANSQEQAHSQIKYLQKRLKEVSHENPSAIYNNNQKQKPAYLNVLKDEFAKVSQELVDLRSLLKGKAIEISASNTLSTFQAFESKVLQSFDEWEQKTREINNLAEDKERQSNESRALFVKMKSLIKEKDQLIGKLRFLLKQKDSSHLNHENQLVSELQRQSYLLKSEIFGEMNQTHQRAGYPHLNQIEFSKECVERENNEIEKRFAAFKEEYMQVLDDKENLRQDCQKYRHQLDAQSQGFSRFQDDHYNLTSKLQQVLGLDKEGEILSKVELMKDTLIVKTDELVAYKAKLQTMESQQEEEKRFLKERLQEVDRQINSAHKQALEKEEDLQRLFYQKETKLLQEISKLDADYKETSKQLQTRERQLKKLQEQIDLLSQQISLLTLNIQDEQSLNTTLIGENQTLLSEQKSLQILLGERQIFLDKQDLQILELQQQLTKTEDLNKYLKEELINREIQSQKDREEQQRSQEEKHQLNVKVQTLQEKSQALEREQQSLYNQNVKQQQTIKEISQAYEEQERDKLQLKFDCEEMSRMILQAQSDIEQSQSVIDQMNAQLEESRKTKQKLRQVKQEVKLFKENEKQLTQIIDHMRGQKKEQQACQTDESALKEVLYLQQEILSQQRNNQIMRQENDHLRDSLMRQAGDIERIIEEKRDLEEIVEQQNQSIKQIRSNHPQKENLNILNSSDLYSKILQEKENYIGRLEAENADLRRENDTLKGMQLEIGQDRSLSGQATRSQSVNMGVPLRNNKAATLNNSINNMSAIQHTGTTYNTLQNQPTIQEDTFKSLNRSMLYNNQQIINPYNN